MSLPPLPSVRIKIGRALIVGVAMIPLLLVVICSLPFELAYPVLPEGIRRSVRERRTQLIKWAREILNGSRD
jgi:hypothetical protein